MRQGDLDPEVVTYSSLIDAFANTFQPDEASQMISETRQGDLDPDVVTNSSLIDAFANTC